MHYIRNDGSSGNAIMVFGTSPDTINGIATATGVSMSVNQGAWFISTANGAWTSTGPLLFTGTGVVGVRQTSPSLITPVLGVAGATSLNLTGGGLTWTNDNTYNFGAVGANRPANIYAGTSVNAPAITASAALTGASTSLTGGGITWVNDNTYNIGAAGANRPANIYVGTNAVIGGTITAGAIASNASAQSGYLCYNTSGGVITYDGGATCLVSLEEYKDNHGYITGSDAMKDVMALRPFWGSYKPDGTLHDTHEQPFLGAHQVESVDPRLAAYGEDNVLRSVRYQNLTAVLVAAIQEQQKQIDRMYWCLMALAAFCGFMFVTVSRLPRPLHSSQ
jgi:hypothetical protein